MHIIGASGHGKVILDSICCAAQQVFGVWDDNPSTTDFFGHEISGNLKDFIEIGSNQYVVAIGNNETRKYVVEQLLETTAIAIHPQSVISKQATLGLGTVVMANATINIGAVVGKHVIVNTNASIDHDCIIGDYAHISPQVGLAGNVAVGEGSHIGIGAMVIQGVKIGKWATIGAGTVIIADVPDYAVVVGNPGKIIKYNQIK